MVYFTTRACDDIPSTLPPKLGANMKSDQRASTTVREPLTWQQQEGLGRTKQSKRRARKNPESVPLNIVASATQPETSATNHLAKELEQTHNAAPGAYPKVATPRHCRPNPSTDAPNPQAHDNVAGKPRSNRKKRKPHNERKPTKMTANGMGAYLPPHRRKHAAAAATQSRDDVKLGDCIAIRSPPDSVKSRPEKQIENEPSPTKILVQEQGPISPPETVEDSSKPVTEYKGWDDPTPEQDAVTSKRKWNPRWPRASKAPREKHVWPKTRDIPRNLPTDSGSDGGVTFKSDSEGDPTYDVKKLMDWNGDWLPPPEEWAARKGFHSRHFGQAIEHWIDGHSRNCIRAMNIDSPDFQGVSQTNGMFLNKDLVPRYWLHDLIDNAAPRKFWAELPQRAPAPCSGVDIMEHPPYWERWEEGEPDNCFMTPLVVPEAKIDIDDAENELDSPFALTSATERLTKIKEIGEAMRRRREAKQNRPVAAPTQDESQLPDRCIELKTNVYLRPVQPSDVRGIMSIYNHYVKNTVHADELDEQTEAQVRIWINDIVQAGLPCLVAIAKRNQRKSPQGYVSETVVGWVHLESFDAADMYRFTFELAMYVHPGYIHQGVGKCLLDQMMDIANTGYSKRGGYEYVNDFEYLKTGKTQIVKTIVLNLHYERGDNVDWASEYFGDFGFKKAGRLSQVGHKIGKVVDMVTFQLQTTEVIDPNSIPAVQIW